MPSPAAPSRARRVAQLAAITVIGAGLLVVAIAMLDGGRFPRSAAGWVAGAGVIFGLNVLAALWERGSQRLVRERRPASVVPRRRR